MALGLRQYLDYATAWGTVDFKNYLFCAVNTSLYAHKVLDDGSLSLVSTYDVGSQLYFTTCDANYLYATTQNSIMAFTFDVGTYTITPVGSPYTKTTIYATASNNNGDIFTVHVPGVEYLRKLRFNGSGFTEVDTALQIADIPYSVAVSRDKVIVVRHAVKTNKNVYVHDIDSMSEYYSSDIADLPDGAYIDNDFFAWCDNDSLAAYEIASPSAILMDRYYESPNWPSFIADNIDYDGAGNFHIHLYISVRHIYFNENKKLINGEELTLSQGSGRINWQCNTYIPGVECFYITKSLKGLFVVSKGDTGIDPFAPVPDITAAFTAEPYRGRSPIGVQFTDLSTVK